MSVARRGMLWKCGLGENESSERDNHDDHDDWADDDISEPLTMATGYRAAKVHFRFGWRMFEVTFMRGMS